MNRSYHRSLLRFHIVKKYNFKFRQHVNRTRLHFPTIFNYWLSDSPSFSTWLKHWISHCRRSAENRHVLQP